ncbi:MAG: PKD domain-containing protein, partial [Methanoregula sp.]|nr:PKD domain-containing protein [Methanoregula sp.]
MKLNVLIIVLTIVLIGSAGLVMPVSGAPLTQINNVSPFESPYGMVFINATVAKYSITELPVYHGTLGENGSIDLHLKSSGDIRWNVTSEEDAPEVARRIMESYGGIPQDAESNGASTFYSREWDFSINKYVSKEPMFTSISYSQANINGLWVIGDKNFLVLDLGDYGEPLWIYKIWRDYDYSGKAGIIPVNAAFEKLRHGEVLNAPMVMDEKITIDMASPGYYAKKLENNDTVLEPVWLLFGNTESGSRLGFHIYARHFANFTASSTNISTFQSVQFTDTSETTPVKWLWDFGDGTNSTEQNPPSHMYRAAGNFTVSLTAWNDMGSDSETKTDYIRVNFNKPLNADFNATPRIASTGDTIQFYDASDSSPNKWYWEFGDGKNTTLRNPTHAYNVGGNYTVNLTAWNSNGSDKRSVENYIRIYPDPKPEADFISNYSWSNNLAPVTVAFNDTSTGNITSWNWDFGDGTNTTEQNPTHVFTVAPDSMGSYYGVNLTVTDIYGRTSSRFNGIAAKKGFNPDFEGEPRLGYAPLNVTFTDLTPDSEYADSAYWSFGDEETIRYWEPPLPRTIFHNYLTPGKYNVTLTYYEDRPASVARMNAAGTTTNEYEGHDAYSYYKTKEFYIVVTSPAIPEADFSANTTSGKLPLTVNFTDLTTGLPMGWIWTFGDGATSAIQNPVHIYSAAGTYPVSLTATNPIGHNTTTKIDYITVQPLSPPVARFTGTPLSGKIPLTVAFNDTSAGSPTSWIWALGDGTNSTEQNPVHTYSSAGNFTVSLAAANPDGSNTMTKTGYIAVLPMAPPVAAFTANTTAGNTPLAVAFTDASTGSPAIWSWTFGDGSTSADQNPVHVYTTPGQFTVSLQVTNPDGSDTTTKEQFISGSTPLLPIAEFTANQTSGKAPLAVGFTDQSTGAPVSWHWTFGDGTLATEQNPAHIYTATGTYTVSLEVTNPDGSNTRTKADFIIVSSVSVPVASFSGKPTSGKAPL